MLDIVYFVVGNNGRYINKSKPKITIGNSIVEEGYYIGERTEKATCWIFYGKPYKPAITDIPARVNFDPNSYRSGILQDSIRYWLVKHKKSDAYFCICSYLIDSLSYKEKYFSDLLAVIDGKWEQITEWPFCTERNAKNSILERWKKCSNYYEQDFEIITELEGKNVTQSA